MPRKNHRSGHQARARRQLVKFSNHGEFNPAVLEVNKKHIEPYIPASQNKPTFKIPQYVPTKKHILKSQPKPALLKFPAQIYKPVIPQTSSAPSTSASINELLNTIAHEFPPPPPLITPLQSPPNVVQSSAKPPTSRYVRPPVHYRPVSINYPPPNEPFIPFHIIPPYRMAVK